MINTISNSELYPQFVSQIQKDLNRAGIDYTIVRVSNPKELFEEIQRLIFEKLTHNFNEYLNWLYAVDVSEVEVRNIKSEHSKDISQKVTYLILKREWQKVWYRNKF
ncbi:hypothetical protein [Aquimarina addita]|uniref:hypothetical protein n=1 Tax=Aquimarina addita TaxID=870485 RepID=UPI0031F19ACF